MSAIQPIPFDKYLLLDRIAVGGMAEVYRGKLIGEKGFEKPVVLKKMHPHLTDEEEMVALFIDEARLAAQLKHENIIHIYDFGNKSGTFYIAMEYLFGKDLHQVIKKAAEKRTPLQLEHILFVMQKVCEGLGYAHNLKDLQGNHLNIIHRDVSPQNIFITYEGQVKIIDFGIAKAATKATKTQTGIIKGKVAYMSPEQASGKTIDYRSDIFSVGIILYELVTGKKMFEGDTFQVLSQVIEAKYDPPEKLNKELPAGLCSIIEKALRVDPESRYQSCDEMASDLENLLYDLKCRPNIKSLSKYMRALYADSFDREKQEMSECMLTGSVGTPPGAVSAKGGQTEMLAPKPGPSSGSSGGVSGAAKTRKPYEPTEVIHTGSHPTDDQKTVVVMRLPKDKKTLSLVLIGLLLFLGVGGLFYKKQHEKNQQINYLLSEAERGLQEERIIFPRNNSSVYYYQEVLRIDPQNERAMEGKKNAVAHCVQQAEDSMAIFNISTARDYILACIKIDPTNQKLRKLERETSSGGGELLLNKVKDFMSK